LSIEKLPTTNSAGYSIMVTRPTTAPLIEELITIFLGVRNTSRKPLRDASEQELVDIAILTNDKRACSLLSANIDCCRNIRDLLWAQMKPIADAISKMEDDGRLEIAWSTCLACQSRGEVETFNHLNWTLNELRKRLRNFACIIGIEDADDAMLWRHIMSLPPGIRMLDLPTYFWSELVMLELHRNYNTAALHRVISGRLTLELEDLQRVIAKVKRFSPEMPNDEVLPLTVLSDIKRVPYEYGRAADRLQLTAAMAISKRLQLSGIPCSFPKNAAEFYGPRWECSEKSSVWNPLDFAAACEPAKDDEPACASSD